MKTAPRILLFQLALALFLWAGTAAAQQNSIGVVLYADCNYAGASASLPAVGRYTTNQLLAQGLRDNVISSLRVPPGYEVVLFDNGNFTGDSLSIGADADCLVAQGWNDRASSLVVRAAATLYRDCNYAGVAAPLPVGDYTASDLVRLGIGNNDLSSLRVRRGYEVQLYDGDNFQGASITVVGNADCLTARSFDNRTSSLRVRTAGTATLYQDCNFGGYARALPAIGGYTTNQLLALGIRDNDISALRVNSGFEVVLYDGDNFQGASFTVTGANSCLVPFGWNDRVSSVRVRAASLAGSLTAFPNPTTGTVTLTGLKSFPVTVGVYDGRGTLRKTLRLTQSSQPATLNCAELESGLYLLRVEDAQGVRTHRLDKR